MTNYPDDIGARFYHHMGTWLNADELQPHDQGSIDERTGGWAWALSSELPTIAHLDALAAEIRALAAAREWDATADSPPCSPAFASFVDQALQYTSVDWTEAGMMDILRDIIAHLVTALAFVRTQRLTAGEAPGTAKLERILVNEFSLYYQSDEIASVQAPGFSSSILPVMAQASATRMARALGPDGRDALIATLQAMRADRTHPLVWEVSGVTNLMWSDEAETWVAFQELMDLLVANLRVA